MIHKKSMQIEIATEKRVLEQRDGMAEGSCVEKMFKATLKSHS